LKPVSARFLRLLASLASALLLVAAIFAVWFYFQLRASRPQLDGAAALRGLGATVTVERDALGIPIVRGGSRADVARALGFLHAQDRFFQMDLMRRRAAGELAELLGKAALPADQGVRLHGFRRLARQALALDTPALRGVIEAYTTGVNAGLAALGQAPFEYLVLRTNPQPWLPEDCYLLTYAMTLNLQEATGGYERALALLRDVYNPEVVAFFAPLLTPVDAALDGTAAPLPPIPPPAKIDLRLRATVAATGASATADPLPAGSNSFALAGNRTANGAALLANDMHLRLGVPNTWYRTSLVWPGHQVTGFTLPGTPAVVVGSNGRVAWGFTNSQTDTSDVVIVEPNIIDRSLYKRGVDNIEFGHRTETIRVKGGEPVALEVQTTVWGPVIGLGEKNRPLAYHWVMHEPSAVNFALLNMENATSVDDAVAVAHVAGIPAQNILIADDAGRIAWTIAGRLPKRIGYDGRFPVAWTYGDRYWDGFLSAAETPVIRQPASGQLWSANARPVGGAALAVLGDGGYDKPARAAQIRDDLSALTQATSRDLLAVQLDDRALFLDRWQQLLLRILTSEVVAGKKPRAELRALADRWDGRAAVDSVSYRLVRAFRHQVANLVLSPVFTPCVERDESFNWRKFRYEEPLWALLQEKPAHLLNPAFTRWDELLVAAADAVMADLKRQDETPAQANWGRTNTVRIQHPLSRVLPRWLTDWLNLPAEPLPGDSDMPRIQGPAFGASERMVVAPGREAEGLAHMPGGQSGHPLSPYYRAGHAAWVQGEPTPFLPGPAQHTLVLQP
jgi:penicillin amidase